MDYSTVTETPDIKITQEALSMLYTRYLFAKSYCEGKDVLEVACGAGQGLGFLHTSARSVVGGDFTDNLVQSAANHYNGRVPVMRLDAQSMPFKSDSFDVIILYEAIYYLEQPDLFLSECRRMLRNQGYVLICSANKEWSGFNPSPYSHMYYSTSELAMLLQKHQFTAEVYGSFNVESSAGASPIVSTIKKLAVATHLIPSSMKGKEMLKRIFLGKLETFPQEITEGIADYNPPQPVASTIPTPDYKVIYAVGQSS